MSSHRVAYLVAGMHLVVATGLSLASEPTLFPDPVSPLGYLNVWDASPADFNEDGHADLAVAGRYGVVTLLGDGNGGFQETWLDSVLLPYIAAVGDFNGDGHQDIVTDDNASRLIVYLGNGDGTFSDSTVAYDHPSGLIVLYEVADFDGDGNDDLYVPIDLAGEVLLSDGEGGFAFSTDVFPRGAVGDFNEDGDLDLVRGAPSQLELALGNGDGTFDCCALVPISIVDGADHHLVDDFDGDGHDDVAGASNDNDVWVIYGDGTGAFHDETHYAAGDPRHLGFGDLDGDGRGDLYVGGKVGDMDLYLLYGNAEGRFDTPVAMPTVLGSLAPVAVDVDEDDAIDLVAFGGDDLSIQRGVGARRFEAPERRVFDIGRNNDLVLLVEGMDCGEDLDVVVADQQEPVTIAVLPNDGQANLAAPVVLSNPDFKPSRIAAGRLNDDDMPDIIARDWNDSVFHLFFGQGLDPLLPAGQIALDDVACGWLFQDVNGDQLSDFVATFGDPLNTVTVYLNQGDGTIGYPRTYPINGAHPCVIAAAELNGDAYPDLITSSTGRDGVQLSVLLGTESGIYTAETNYPTGGGTLRQVVDFDGDGRMDAVVTGPAVMLGAGDGSFGEPIPLGADGDSPRELLDVDLDGRMDIRVDAATFQLGVGGFAFGPPQSFGVLGDVELGDVDGDGRPDIVATGADQELWLLTNWGPTTLSFAADRVTLGWPFDPQASSYEVYRGNLTDLIDVDTDGAADDGYGSCLAEVATSRNELLTTSVPPGGTGFFYLVSNVASTGLGMSSSGVLRVPADACP